MFRLRSGRKVSIHRFASALENPVTAQHRRQRSTTHAAEGATPCNTGILRLIRADFAAQSHRQGRLVPVSSHQLSAPPNSYKDAS